jgi:hypothetical protein
MDLMARTCNYERMNAQRMVARGFVVLGGVFWIAAAIGAGASYLRVTPLATTGMALIPLLIVVVVFIVGWLYETLAALLLGVGALAVVIWGVVAGWEAGVWGTMIAVLVAPMIIAALLYLLAAQTERVCALEESKTA